MVYADLRSWMEGTYDIPNKNPNFFVTTELKHAKMQIISYIFIYLYEAYNLG